MTVASTAGSHRKLTIVNAPLSIHHHMVIAAEGDSIIYEAASHAGIFGPTWEVKRNVELIASMKLLAGLTRNWHVTGAVGDFKVHKRALSISNVFEISGGRYEGCVFHGDVLDRTFTLKRNDTVLAEVRTPLFSLGDVHQVELLDSSLETERLTVMCLVLLHEEHLHQHGKF